MDGIAETTTLIAKTFLRPNCANRLIDSIRTYYPLVRIMIADDGDTPLTRSDAEVFQLPFDSGVSLGRNFLADRVATEYLVLVDDDHVFTPATRIEHLIEPLERDQFDLVAGLVEQNGKSGGWSGLFACSDGVLKLTPGDRGLVDGVCRVDFCQNFFAARASAVRSLRWDEALKMGEHVDFFLRAQSNMRVGVCPNVSISHMQDTPEGYKQYRSREVQYRQLMMRKHGLREIVYDFRPEGPFMSVKAEPERSLLSRVWHRLRRRT